MSFKRLVSYSAANTAAAVVKIKDQMLLIGWTMHDDQSGAGNPYYILKSYGEDSTAEVPVYIMVGDSVTANKIYWRMFLYWNNVTHTGVVEMGTSTSDSIWADDDDSFYMWIYGCKDWVIVITKLASTYHGSFVIRYNTTIDSNIGELQSNSGTGVDKVLQLGSGEASTFVSGRHTALVCVDGSIGRQYDLEISAVDRANDTITISTSISYDFPSGSFIGTQPHHWVIGLIHTPSYNYILKTTGIADQTDYITFDALITTTYFEPDSLTNLYGLIPILLHYTTSLGLSGIIEKGFFMDTFTSTSYEDTVATERKDNGNVTNVSNNSLDSTGHNWITNEFTGKAVIITTGVGIGQERDILSNTDNQIIVDEDWVINPEVDDDYVIADRAYRHFGWTREISVQECGEMDI